MKQDRSLRCRIGWHRFAPSTKVIALGLDNYRVERCVNVHRGDRCLEAKLTWVPQR